MVHMLIHKLIIIYIKQQFYRYYKINLFICIIQ